MNQPKKFTDLLAGATKPTPANASMETWAHENYERRTAMNQIRDRLSPAVMREVWEALNVNASHGCDYSRRALALLDGQEQGNKEAV